MALQKLERPIKVSLLLHFRVKKKQFEDVFPFIIISSRVLCLRAFFQKIIAAITREDDLSGPYSMGSLYFSMLS